MFYVTQTPYETREDIPETTGAHCDHDSAGHVEVNHDD